MADPRDEQTCIARGGRWENGVCFMPDEKEEAPKERINASDPARGELRQKQLEEDPKFAEAVEDPTKSVREADKVNRAREAVDVIQAEPLTEPAPEEELIAPLPGGFTSETRFKEASEKYGMTGPEFGAAKRRLFAEERPTEKKVLDVVSRVGLAALGGLTAITAVQAAAPLVAGFLSKATPQATKAAASGSRALGTNPRALGTNPKAVQAVLTAPAKLKVTNGILKASVATAATFFGLGQIKSVATDLLLSESKKIKSKVSLVGEKLTKIPETSSHGFTVEDGVVTEYTQAMALQDIAEVEQSLLDAKETLQQMSIGNAYLKLKGEHDIAIDEVDKQLGEIAVAQSKVLEQIAAPSEKQLAVREFWENVDLE